VQKKRWVERDTMKKGAGRVEGDDMLIVVEKVVVRGPHTSQLPRISEWIHF
jgi:hypothetical protein